jgi:hypothetical protein
MKNVDVFPAVLKLAPPDSLSDYTTLDFTTKPPDGTRRLDRCRIVVVQETIMIAVDSPEGPELVFREAITDLSSEGDLFHVRTESAKILAFKKDRNCGCGSRLRSWQPYKHLSSNEDS